MSMTYAYSGPQSEWFLPIRSTLHNRCSEQNRRKTVTQSYGATAASPPRSPGRQRIDLGRHPRRPAFFTTDAWGGHAAEKNILALVGRRPRIRPWGGPHRCGLRAAPARSRSSRLDGRTHARVRRRVHRSGRRFHRCRVRCSTRYGINDDFVVRNRRHRDVDGDEWWEAPRSILERELRRFQRRRDRTAGRQVRYVGRRSIVRTATATAATATAATTTAATTTAAAAGNGRRVCRRRRYRHVG